jgi:hypothetical protein
MATLVKKHNKYYIRVRLPGGKEKMITTQTGNRREAERRLRLVIVLVFSYTLTTFHLRRN